jgi:prephenate dehydratase
VGWRVIEAHDTAGAARLVKESADVTTAALCPVAAAQTYGLRVIEQHCGDDPNAVTAFYAVTMARG